MEFYSNATTAHQISNLNESSSLYGAEIQDEMQTSGGNFGNAVQSCRLEEPSYLDSGKSGRRFRGPEPYRSTATNQTSCSSSTNSNPWEVTLNPRDIQNGMQPYAVDLRLPVNNLVQSLPNDSTEINSYNPIADPRETNLTSIPSYDVDITIRSPVSHSFHSHPTISTNMIPDRHSVDPRGTNPKGIPTNAMDFSGDRNPYYHLGNPWEKDPNGMMSSHTTYEKGKKDRNGIQSGETESPEVTHATRADLKRINDDVEERNFHQVTHRENPQFTQPILSYPLNQTCSQAGTSSQKTIRLQGGAPFYHATFQGELASQVYEKGSEGGSNFIYQTSSDGRIRSKDLPFNSQQTTVNERGFTRTCPRCHCVVASQPQTTSPPTTPGIQNTRTSVIMLPQKREVEETKKTSNHFAVGNQKWPSPIKRPLENESDLSEEDKDDEDLQETFFRVNIDGTTARFKLTEEDWAKMPIKSFPSGGRLLSGDWTRIFLNKVKESNPWCSLRFKNNHVRSENSRKMHSSVFFRGGAECKYPECSVKLRFVIKKDYGRRVDVTYIGNVCHASYT